MTTSMEDGTVQSEEVSAQQHHNQLVKSVRSILSGTSEATHEGYLKIISELQNRQEQTVVRLLRAIAECVDIIAANSGRHETLLQIIFDLDWQYSVAVQKAYVNLLYHLLSVDSCFINSVLVSLVKAMQPGDDDEEKNFTDADWKQDTLKTQSVPLHKEDLDNLTEQSPHKVSRIIALRTCRDIQKLIPTCTSQILRTAIRAFPHKYHPSWKLRSYTRRFLSLAEALPLLRDRIVTYAIEKMIDMDVEIRLEEVPDELLEEDADIENSGFNNEQIKRFKASIAMAEKLDAVMEELIIYLDQLCDACRISEASQSNDGSSFASLQRRRDHVFALLLNVFEKSILHTHRSKYTQFLIFYFCRLGSRLADMFVGRLLHHCMEGNGAAVTRHACAAYIGSYVARAKYLEHSTVRQTLFYLLKWIHSRIDEWEALEDKGKSVHIESDDIFYSVCQSAFYIVCFRAAEFQESAEATKYLQSFYWGRVVSCKADPLEHCLESVACEFIRIAEILHLVPKSQLEPFRRSSSPTAMQRDRSESGENNKAKHGPLHGFFPFDPFLLKRCSNYIQGEGLYRYWKPLEDTETQDDEAVSSDDSEDEEMNGHRESMEDDGGGSKDLRQAASDGMQSRLRGLSFDEEAYYATLHSPSRKNGVRLRSISDETHGSDPYDNDHEDFVGSGNGVPGWDVFRKLMGGTE